jgi:hypothetical protein
MRDVPCIEFSSFLIGQKVLRMVARDVKHPSAALVYWLGIAEPSHEANFFEATRKFENHLAGLRPPPHGRRG